MADESQTDEPQLKVERDGNVVVLTMNNPSRKNALTPAMITLMAQAWDEIDADDGIRVAIFTREGSSYCVGGDLADGWMVRGAKGVTALPSEVKRARRPARLGEDAQRGRDGVVISLN